MNKILTKEEILNQFEPNQEYPSYYHEQNVLEAIEAYHQQFSLQGQKDEKSILNIHSWLTTKGIPFPPVIKDDCLIWRIEEYIKKQYPESSPEPSAQNEWIAVEDGLPKDGEDVLCLQKNNDLPLMSNYQKNNGFEVKSYPTEGSRILIAYWNDVTHWQSLPKIPQSK